MISVQIHDAHILRRGIVANGTAARVACRPSPVHPCQADESGHREIRSDEVFCEDRLEDPEVCLPFGLSKFLAKLGAAFFDVFVKRRGFLPDGPPGLICSLSYALGIHFTQIVFVGKGLRGFFCFIQEIRRSFAGRLRKREQF